jgi:hypothetical protein
LSAHGFLDTHSQDSPNCAFQQVGGGNTVGRASRPQFLPPRNHSSARAKRVWLKEAFLRWSGRGNNARVVFKTSRFPLLFMARSSVNRIKGFVEDGGVDANGGGSPFGEAKLVGSTKAVVSRGKPSRTREYLYGTGRTPVDNGTGTVTCASWWCRSGCSGGLPWGPQWILDLC